MQLEYKVQLPDHDYVISAGHKLIPSVIGNMEITPRKLSGEAVTYSGATYIAIRSAKHSGSSAFHHLVDMKRVRELPEFDKSFLSSQGTKKPVMIVTVDGGPDENPRYTNTIDCCIDYFNTEDLDALFVATNAPGRSAFNRVERKMAPLSKEVAGVILNHEHFGTHLDSQGNTIDAELELKNFEHAGKVLAEIWSALVVDGHPVVAEYIKDEKTKLPTQKSEKWKAKHVRGSQYFLQIVKCDDRNCCSEFKSSYRKIVKNRFLPPPLPVIQGKNGLELAKDDTNGHYLSLHQNLSMSEILISSNVCKQYKTEIPYDLMNPVIQKDELKRRRK